jgi:hypothetical protein
MPFQPGPQRIGFPLTASGRVGFALNCRFFPGIQPSLAHETSPKLVSRCRPARTEQPCSTRSVERKALSNRGGNFKLYKYTFGARGRMRNRPLDSQFEARQLPHFPPQLRHTPAGGWRQHSHRPGALGHSSVKTTMIYTHGLDRGLTPRCRPSSSAEARMSTTTCRWHGVSGDSTVCSAPGNLRYRASCRHPALVRLEGRC